MPVRGYDSYLQSALDSILRQTYAQLEVLLLVYPDADAWLGSLKYDARVRVITRPQAGIVSALNTGIAHAKGRYIARMDADDIALADRIEQQLDFLHTHPRIAIAGAKVRLFRDDGEIHQGNQRYQQWLNSVSSALDVHHNMFVESPLPHPTWMAKTQVFTDLQGYRDCDWPEDYDFLLRAHLHGFAMGKPATELLLWREHKERLTYMDSRYAKVNFIRAKAWALAQSLAAQRPVIICGTGRNAVRLCDALREFDVTVTSFVEHSNARKRSSRRHLPVIDYNQLADTDRSALTVSAVSAFGAREKLRTWFQVRGWRESEDFIIAG